MRLTFRTKLMTIFSATALSFLVSMLAQTILTGRMGRELIRIQEHYIPIIEIGPRLESGFENLRRSFQDSVAAQDRDELEKTGSARDKVLEDAKAASGLIDSSQVSDLKAAIQDYHSSAYAVSARLISGETGMTLVNEMSLMQAKQARVESILRTALTFDRGRLMEAFSAIENAQKTSGRLLVLISVACLVIVMFLSIVLSRGVLRSLTSLSGGLRRFGQGHYSDPIVVTGHDELEDLAHEANQMAVRTKGLMKELESFSYSVAHDLRAPLRSIQGFSKIIMDDHGGSLPGDAKESLERVIASARRMGQLIDSLLNLSRLARTEMKKEFVNLSSLAQEIISELKGAQPDRKVQATFQEGIVVKGDASLLRIALTNLLGNSWKFTSRIDSAKIEFGVENRCEDQVYFVRDNGAGFDMQYAEKLFGTFHRLHSSEEFEGSGIGLATVRTIIRRHGGEIWAEGKVDQGATFYFSLWNQTDLKNKEGGQDVERNDITGGR